MIFACCNYPPSLLGGLCLEVTCTQSCVPSSGGSFRELGLGLGFSVFTAKSPSVQQVWFWLSSVSQTLAPLLPSVACFFPLGSVCPPLGGIRDHDDI